MKSFCFSSLFLLFPPSLVREIEHIGAGIAGFESRLSEIRLRKDRRSSLTLGHLTIPLQTRLHGEDIATLFHLFCKRSVYACAGTLAEGYLSAFGCRIGVCGRAVLVGDALSGVHDISGLFIRIPHAVAGAGDALYKLFIEKKASILLYAPPALGKTTALCDFALQCSSGKQPLRTVVVDSRGEFDGFLPEDSLADVYLGFPKGDGILTAIRTASPEVVICDEIGGATEADAILSSVHSGVPFVASTHGDTLENICRRPPIAKLLSHHVFSYAVGLSLVDGKRVFDVADLSMADALC